MTKFSDVVESWDRTFQPQNEATGINEGTYTSPNAQNNRSERSRFESAIKKAQGLENAKVFQVCIDGVFLKYIANGWIAVGLAAQRE